MHVHVRSADGEAKYWLEPRIELVRNHGFTSAQLRHIASVIEEHYDEFVAAWRAHFGG